MKKGLTGMLAASVMFASAIHGADVGGKGILSYSQNGTVTTGDEFAPSVLLTIDEQLNDGNTVRILLGGQTFGSSQTLGVQEMSLTSTSFIPMLSTTVGTFQRRVNKVGNAFKGYQDIVDAREFKTGVSVGYNSLEMVDLYVAVDNGLTTGGQNTLSNMNLAYGAQLKTVENLTAIVQMDSENIGATDDKTEATKAFVGYELDKLRVSASIDNYKNDMGSTASDQDNMGVFAAFEVMDNLEVFVNYAQQTDKPSGASDQEETTTTFGVSRSFGSARTVTTYETVKPPTGDETTQVTFAMEYNF